MEIVSGAEIGQRLGVTREAVRQWRRRPGFPEPVGKVGQSIAWDWEDVRRWADQRPTHAIIKHGGACD
jgi:predicted DNA-binding transcriptional regulator AlpA